MICSKADAKCTGKIVQLLSASKSFAMVKAQENVVKMTPEFSSSAFLLKAQKNVPTNS